MSATFWTPARDAEVARLLKGGMTPADVAFSIGTSVDAVRRRLKAIRRDTLFERQTGPVVWTPERLRELRRMRSEGMRSSAIARALGVSESAVAAQTTRMSLSAGQIPPAEIDAIVEMAEEGATLARIARRHRLDEVAVEAILKRFGVVAGQLPQSYRGAEARRASR